MSKGESMLKQIIALMICSVVLWQAKAYGVAVETVSGVVRHIDVEAGVIDVKTKNGMQIFYVVTESQLFMSEHFMSSVEIERDDPVIIQYVYQSSGKKTIVKLVDKR